MLRMRAISASLTEARARTVSTSPRSALEPLGVALYTAWNAAMMARLQAHDEQGHPTLGVEACP
jgi:hypothetical protein